MLAEGLVPTNLLGNAVATIVISKWEGALDTKRLDAVLADPTSVSAQVGVQAPLNEESRPAHA